jgi:hypothetical protein
MDRSLEAPSAPESVGCSRYSAPDLDAGAISAADMDTLSETPALAPAIGDPNQLHGVDKNSGDVIAATANTPIAHGPGLKVCTKRGRTKQQ